MTTWEVAVRPFVSPFPKPAFRPLPVRTPPGDSGDSALRWGQPSRFIVTGSGVSINQPSEPLIDGETEESDAAALDFVETSREVEVIRVFNPQDENQWVDVERIEQISFRGPDGVIRRFILNH